MKPLTFSSVAGATALLLFCSAFSSNNERITTPAISASRPVSGMLSSPSEKKALTAPLRRVTYYYWYSVPDDTYDCYNDPADEAGKLEVELQVQVDDDPFGGTEIMAGYINNEYPHMVWPTSFLYAHYDD